MAIFIPHDVLLHHILPRLPTKSVGRFRCLSKELHSFLSSNVFKNMHSRHIDYDHHNKFLVLCFDEYGRKPVTLSTIDCEAPDNLTPKSFRPPRPPSGYKVTFLTSFHGLVCLTIIKEYPTYPIIDNSELILWNPMTSDYKKLSKPKSYKDRRNIWTSAFGMFYSSCEDDYKLLSVISHNNFDYKLMSVVSHNNVEIYSLKSDSWRTIALQYKSDLQIDRLLQGTTLKENLYFLNDSKYYSVVKFDTKTEMFAEMKVTPALNIIENSYCSTLMVKKDHIHVCIMYGTMKFGFRINLIELWKISEEGNWKMMVTYQVDASQMGGMKPLHLTRNGNLLMRGRNLLMRGKTHGHGNFDYLYNIDLKNIKLNMQKPCKGIGKGKDLLPVANRPISETVRYIETFVSPNQYIK